VITKTGKVDRVGILEGASPELDAECIRVIENLPEFEPGRKDGQPVDVWYAVPITFTLRDSGSKLKK
jgi:protein TonB